MRRRRGRGYSGFRGYGRRRGRGKTAAIVLGVILAIVLLIGILLFATQIKEIEVTGNQHYTEEQIIDLIFDEKWSKNSAYCYYENKFQEPKSIPFIEEYKVEFQSPSKVRVVVFEKSVVGYVSYMSSYMYFDKDGIIVESSVEQLPGIPWITGMEFGHIVLHQPLPVANQDIFDQILNLTQVLSVNGVRVDKINYNSFLEAELTIGDIIVELGNDDDLNGKVSELSDILPELTGLSGTLYLDSYDENNSNPMYTFKKN
ncbi:MAG: FtsQ-type POTRA domain-containing protein [Lachnospiraceae bacterium]|jgi:cell division protein FtsQ|nr:FtsQ-type POTRA domain-containing protein [Lachnospiraceae bacterium]MBQ2022826.1 FtsQ-type POTRA domain-containing protein [Lachnospiraceae bacterium]MBQ2401698.1 FtsQ-type POTRA domain-containing protein [Lachnospiraceae bacterium]MBQ2426382.1 FtsQ-type POTRA domain-containing protein [Lachnospiraceae bacterium]MBQ5598645.1 FtsQ-type POTRA domain-containing protein [Lachnospiraceae bacterium]